MLSWQLKLKDQRARRRNGFVRRKGLKKKSGKKTGRRTGNIHTLGERKKAQQQQEDRDPRGNVDHKNSSMSRFSICSKA